MRKKKENVKKKKTIKNKRADQKKIAHRPFDGTNLMFPRNIQQNAPSNPQNKCTHDTPASCGACKLTADWQHYRTINYAPENGARDCAGPGKEHFVPPIVLLRSQAGGYIRPTGFGRRPPSPCPRCGQAPHRRAPYARGASQTRRVWRAAAQSRDPLRQPHPRQGGAAPVRRARHPTAPVLRAGMYMCKGQRRPPAARARSARLNRRARFSRCVIYQWTTLLSEAGARWPTMPPAAHKETASGSTVVTAVTSAIGGKGSKVAYFSRSAGTPP